MAHDDTTPTGSRIYSRDKRAVLSATAMLIASTSFGIGAWAHAKLWEANTRMTILETQQRSDSARQATSDSRLDRIENKLDLILERQAR